MPTQFKQAHDAGHLLRSRSQIARVLEALAARREQLTAELSGGGDPFRANLVRADPGGQFIVITASADDGANAALLARARVTLVATPDDWHIEFVADTPSEVMHEGMPAIRLRYPEILTVQQRRQHARHDIPPTLALRCVADAGGIAPFDAQIKDLGIGGVSILLYASDVLLEPGTVLVGSHIEVPGADAVSVDLEVRYSEAVTLADGSRARCSGFRFVNAPEEIKQLIEAWDRR
jgi:c-di-GMP-binding flagellar brake protein YcgR